MKASEKSDVDRRNPVCTAIGRSVKAHRFAAKITQAELAFGAEVDRTFVSEIERGMGNPSSLTLANLCYVLGITLADLFAPVRLSLPPEPDAPRRANKPQPREAGAKQRLRKIGSGA